MRIAIVVVAALAALAGCATVPQSANNAELRRQVADTERAFAKTMADRDYAAFTSFLSSDAIFFSGPEARHGKREVADWWKRFYDKPQAPFSWEPERVEVLDSGMLALSTGPVRDLYLHLAARGAGDLEDHFRQG